MGNQIWTHTHTHGDPYPHTHGYHVPTVLHYQEDYPDPLPDPPPLNKQQIEKVIRRLSPYKVPGPDGIPNIVLQKCFTILADHLLYIYQAILTLGEFYDPWREFTTIVIKKPDKPNYQIPKAYRPIALISTLAKVLTALVAENISHLVELHQLLPKTHFGGRPGRTTTDAIHYLVHKIKLAWADNKVASILFLDVEGAFPNAVTQKLLHNLKKRRIPTIYINFIRLLLTNRRTRIKFDDFTSELIEITNGIGQGDPLSMLLYIIYNADLLEITDDDHLEAALGYVDDIALIAIGNNFDESTTKLQNLMVKEDGGLSWSVSHNSRFEINKSAILHLSRQTRVDPGVPQIRHCHSQQSTLHTPQSHSRATHSFFSVHTHFFWHTVIFFIHTPVIHSHSALPFLVG